MYEFHSKEDALTSDLGFEFNAGWGIGGGIES
jgi:hypothetical protein